MQGWRMSRDLVVQHRVRASASSTIAALATTRTGPWPRCPLRTRMMHMHRVRELGQPPGACYLPSLTCACLAEINAMVFAEDIRFELSGLEKPPDLLRSLVMKEPSG